MYSKSAIYIFATLLCILVEHEGRAVVLDSPNNFTGVPGQYANFTCTVPCTHFIDWFVEGHPYVLRGVVEGLSYRIRPITSCNGGGNYTESLDILTTVELNKTTLQCAAVSSTTVTDGGCSLPVSYSRFAVLTVDPDPEPLLPSPSPVLCSSVSVSTTTETTTITVTPTVTVFVTPPANVEGPTSAVLPLSLGVSWKILASIAIAITTAALFL